MEKKKKYDELMQPYYDVEKITTEAKKEIIEAEVRKKAAEETLKKSGLSTAEQSTAKQTIEQEKLKITAQTEIIKGNAKDLAKALKTLNSSEFATARKEYETAQQAYIKRSGKAQSLNNLVSRTKESISKSFKRLSIPDFGIDRKITRKSKIYSRANVTNKTATPSQKKDKDWIVAYWTKQKSGRPQELKRLINKGEIYLKAPSAIKKGPDGKPLLAADKTPLTTLRDIIEKNTQIPIPKGKIFETMTNKEFATHINKLQEAGLISIKEYDVLKKTHQATRIQQIIDDAAITKSKKNIEERVTALDDVKKVLGADYGKTPIKMDSEFIKVGFGDKDVSDYKLHKAYIHEFEEEKNKMKLALDKIENTTDPVEKQSLINNLYKRYNPVETNIPNVKTFKRDTLESNEDFIHAVVKQNL